MNQLNSLESIFFQLKNKKKYKAWTKKRIAKIILGSSVIRVFVKRTKPLIIDCLDNIPVEELNQIKTQKEYDQWHKKQIGKIYNCITEKRGNITRIGNKEGLKFGHSTKILNLYIGHLIFYSPFFNKPSVKKLSFLLHVPLDKKVFDALKSCGIKDVPSSIKKVNKKTYNNLQKIIRSKAHEHAIAPLYFDEYAWAFDKDES